MDPVVSICCAAFNHEQFIKDALDGFLIQKTSFPFEIIIHDDASIDKTAEIIREYELQYPNIISAIFQSENQYSQGNKPYPNFIFPRVRGKYIALCEGDDYWTDPLKLQKQVDFLEENMDVSLTCTHKAVLKDGVITKCGDSKEVKFFTEKNVLTDFIAPTQTIVLRNLKGLSEFMIKHPLIYGGDRAITYYASLHGRIAILPFWGSVYRITPQGVSTGLSLKPKTIVRFQSSIDLHYSLGMQCNYLLVRTLIGSFLSLNFKLKLLFLYLVLTRQIKLRYSIFSYIKAFILKRMPNE